MEACGEGGMRRSTQSSSLCGQKYVDSQTLHPYVLIEYEIALTTSTLLVSVFPPDVEPAAGI